MIKTVPRPTAQGGILGGHGDMVIGVHSHTLWSKTSQSWCHIPVTVSLQGAATEHDMFKACLGYSVSSRPSWENQETVFQNEM